jgi:hypothetical protein
MHSLYPHRCERRQSFCGVVYSDDPAALPLDAGASVV